MIFSWFKKNANEAVVLRLYNRVGDKAREPWLYLDAGIADTVEGRLEALMLHALLVMRRLSSLPAPGPEVAQDFIDQLFLHIDHGLRELGVGDTSVPKRMKKIGQNFYGRVKTYEQALTRRDPIALAEALERNIPGVRSAYLAAWVLASDLHLQGLDLEALIASDGPLYAPVQERPSA